MAWHDGLVRTVMRLACDVDRRLRRVLDGAWLVPGRDRPPRCIQARAYARVTAVRVPAQHEVDTRRRQVAAAATAVRVDHRVLSRDDVEALWRRHRQGVLLAFQNFAALRCIPIPIASDGAWEIEESLRDVINTIGAYEGLAKLDRLRVYHALMIAFVTLPLGMALPSPFGLVDELDHVTGDAPRMRAAVQWAWSVVDDPTFWKALHGGPDGRAATPARASMLASPPYGGRRAAV